MHESTAIVRIPFHGDELLTIEADGKPRVALRPVIEGLGLDFSTQQRKLRGRSWACVGQSPMQMPGDDQSRMVTVVDVRTLVMLLATINENRVAEHVRPKLVAYQSEVADAIEAYWTRGVAVNPRSVASFEPVTYTWPEAAAVMRQRYGIDMTEHTLIRLLRAAGVIRADACRPKRAHENMFWFAGTHWEIHQHAVPLLLRKAEDVGRELREFRFLQTRLELDGVGIASIDA